MSLITTVQRIVTVPFLLVIFIYQKGISPLLPPSCIYYPSCSEYARQAFLKHGVIKGLYLATKRILSCHPFHQGGVDEVPDDFSLFKH